MEKPTVSRLATRSSNRDKHPGQPDVKASRRTKQDMADARENANVARQRQVSNKLTKIQKVALLEDSMAVDDREQASRGRDHSKTTLAKVVRPIANVVDGQTFSHSMVDNILPEFDNVCRSGPRKHSSSTGSRTSSSRSSSGQRQRWCSCYK
jgi:hypothetical protein